MKQSLHWVLYMLEGSLGAANTLGSLGTVLGTAHTRRPTRVHGCRARGDVSRGTKLRYECVL